MKISIIIVSYNVKELLDKCLKSVQIAIKNIDSEIFVVDNNSHDKSTQLVKEKYPEVKLIANKKNLGFSRANNQALKAAKGDYLLILNPDTELMPDTIIKMVSFMDAQPPLVSVTTCKVQLPNGALDKDCRRSFPTPIRALAHFSQLSKIFKGSKIFDSYYMGHIPSYVQTEVDACVGAFMLIRSTALATVGHFDEDYFFYGEDLDLCYRMKEKGYKIVYTPITKIIHHKGVSSGIKKHTAEISKATRQSRQRAIIESTRAMKLFYKKHYQDKYPFIVTVAVLMAIEIIKYMRITKIAFT